MNNTGYLHDDRYLLHSTGLYHPEIPDRLIAIYEGIKRFGLLDNLLKIKAEKADLKWIELVHDPSYVEYFKNACSSGDKTFICSDNQMCKKTYEVANLAIGGILKTADKLMNGEIDNAFCAVRPPGHHAESNQAMGFCYFNNIAILAKYLKKEWHVEKVGIIDFDVHHGNGTQHIFEEDTTVFYYSIHQHPSFSFPGTGRNFDEGVKKGIGFTKNSPIMPGEGDDTYRSKIAKDLLPAFEKFEPEIILISTGFDAHEDDDMSNINLSTEGFSWIIKTIIELAEQYSEGRLMSILEGGYCLEKLPELAANHVKALLNK